MLPRRMVVTRTMANTDTTTKPADGEERIEIDSTEAFVQNNPLVGLLTPGARVRILAALINLRGDRLNPSGICERSGISHDTWYKHRDDLIDVYGVVEEAGNMGNSPLYRVDMDDPIVQRLEEVLGLATERRNRATNPENE